ncbi:23 kDa integral membrane protein-like [Vanessa atalanta]|uniref:23 kDa integral membrane protein-like n=1 Tax=Vanessa atalanta TaxID=42275 RepID=UPI001FCCDF4D|nr:23 kDa integral membrane protein-like [Vanessa atalanta]
MCLCLVSCIVKYILISINLILTLVGLAIIGLGVGLLMILRNVENAEPDDFNLLPILIIVVGCVITIIFFLGCCGAMTRNMCMLISYSVIIVILASLTVGLTVMLSHNTTSVTDMATEMFNGTDDMVLNSFESVLKCCGTTGPESYLNTSLPLSCCPEALMNIQQIQQNIDFSSISTDINVNAKELCSINDAFPEGCVAILKNILNTAINILICICIGEYLAAGMAIFFTCSIRRRK